MQKLITLFIATFIAITGRAQWIEHIAGIPDMVHSYAYSGNFAGDGGPATLAKFDNCLNAIADASGNIYIADFFNGRVRKIDAATGKINTIIGGGTAVAYDGIPALASNYGGVQAICLAPDGLPVFVSMNISAVIKLRSDGTLVKLAGMWDTDIGYGTPYQDSVLATATSIQSGIRDICYSASGELYIAHPWAILKVTADGYIHLVAGNIDSEGDVGNNVAAKDARFNQISGICFDDTGNLYISSWGTGKIHKLSIAGIVSVYAGGGSILLYPELEGCISTDAMLNRNYSICCDHLGNLFVNNRETIIKITPDRIVHRVAGVPLATSYYGDGGLAMDAGMGEGYGCRLTPSGNLLISDWHYDVIRKVHFVTEVPEVPMPVDASVQIYPNPNTGTFRVQLPQGVTDNRAYIYNLIGMLLYTEVSPPGSPLAFNIHEPPGNYLVCYQHNGVMHTSMFQIQ